MASEHDRGAGGGSSRRETDAEREGFTELYERSAPTIFAWLATQVRAPLRGTLDPEDLLQDVAHRAFANRARFTGGSDQFHAWLLEIARSVLFHALERAADQQTVLPSVDDPDRLALLPDTATTLTRAVARSEQMALFLAFVDSLSEEDRLVVVLRGLEGLPHRAVADHLEQSLEAVTQRWSRLRKRLRESGLPTLFVAD